MATAAGPSSCVADKLVRITYSPSSAASAVMASSFRRHSQRGVRDRELEVLGHVEVFDDAIFLS